ncbi:hypothetical protein RCL1_004863 [Eukaryota sp. TZLM3-RCL]
MTSQLQTTLSNFYTKFNQLTYVAKVCLQNPLDAAGYTAFFPLIPVPEDGTLCLVTFGEGQPIPKEFNGYRVYSLPLPRPKGLPLLKDTVPLNTTSRQYHRCKIAARKVFERYRDCSYAIVRCLREQHSMAIVAALLHTQLRPIHLSEIPLIHEVDGFRVYYVQDIIFSRSNRIQKPPTPTLAAQDHEMCGYHDNLVSRLRPLCIGSMVSSSSHNATITMFIRNQELHTMFLLTCFHLFGTPGPSTLSQLHQPKVATGEDNLVTEGYVSELSLIRDLRVPNSYIQGETTDSDETESTLITVDMTVLP